MANASGFCTPTVPSLRRRVSSSSLGIYRSGFCSSTVISRRVLCSSTTEGVTTPSESHLSRLVGKGCKLVGCGSAVPKFQVSNDDLAKFVETNDEWISVRTGIRNRRVLTGDDSLTGLAIESARKALEMAQVDADDVDLVLLCTSTPEDLFGSAPQIQKALGCKKNPLAYDITAACSGFVLGLVSASCYIRGGGFQNVLVIGADALSRYVDWTDRGTCILFGDAAGAACDSKEDGLFGFDLHSDGDGQRFVLLFSWEMNSPQILFVNNIRNTNLFFCRHLNAAIKVKETDHAAESNGSVLGFPPKSSSYSCIQMNGNEVFRFAVRVVPQTIESSLQKAGLTSSSIDWLLLHQANKRILDAVATRLEIPLERVISNLANYGNTSAASIPLALDEAVRSGKVQPGHTIAAAGFGAGLTWGSAILRWG
ncbi:hypothetical protein LguiA_034171 [Lonicera macranthoides]